jgi:signal transduction histidine kinase/CheY-like chemotaxis protein
MGGSDRNRRRVSSRNTNVVSLGAAQKTSRTELEPPTSEQVELALAQMAARVSDGAALPEAEKAQLALLTELLRPKAAFISHYVAHRQQLQVMSVRGRNDPRIAAAAPGTGAVGRAFTENAIIRDNGVIAAPLVARKATIGCLTVLDPRIQVSDELMKALAAQLAAASEVGRLHDESVRRTRDLETAVAGLKSIEKSRDELLSHVSHDLKNPLATIKAYLTMMERAKLGPISEKQSHALAVCNRNADRLVRLISDLVLLSRLKGGDMKLNEKPFGLRALAEEVAKTAAPIAQQGDVGLEVARSGDVFVRGDRARLMEALTNIVEQALFVTPSGGLVRVEISTDEGGFARVAVIDQGPPHSPAELEHLFDSYYRGPGPRSRRPGLGLPIAAKIVRLHGGRIAATPLESPHPDKKGAPPKTGTRIDLSLPMYAGAVTPTELSNPPRPGGILLVEDDADCREVLHEVLEQEGYRVIDASSAGEARSVLANIRPALVFLDIHLQDEDGRSVLRFIRETPALSDVPVFVISGATDLGTLTTGHGPDQIEGFLEKPIQLPRLLDTVASVVRPRRPPAA